VWCSLDEQFTQSDTPTDHPDVVGGEADCGVTQVQGGGIGVDRIVERLKF
jgi:hypothetical protein